MNNEGFQSDPHDVEVVGTRPSDNSLVYKCKRCRKSGIGLLGPCAPPAGRTGRRKKVATKK